MRNGMKGSLAGLACIAALGLPQAATACGLGLLVHGAGSLSAPAINGFAPAPAPAANPGIEDFFREGGRSIVGLWSFKFTAGGNTADFGYVQWHSDGTELMNSGSRAPATENFCMGVYRETSPGHYHLNHYALSYDSSGNLNARVNIKEDVAVDPGGMSYHGSFTLDVYDPKSNALLQHVAGDTTGQRILPN